MKTKKNQDMGKRIKELMVKQGLTTTIMAKIMGVNRSTVSKWVSGTHKPTSDKFKKLADYLESSTEYILNGDIDTDDDTDYIIKMISELPPDLKKSIKILLEHLKKKLERKKK